MKTHTKEETQGNQVDTGKPRRRNKIKRHMVTKRNRETK